MKFQRPTRLGRREEEGQTIDDKVSLSATKDEGRGEGRKEGRRVRRPSVVRPGTDSAVEEWKEEGAFKGYILRRGLRRKDKRD